MILSLDFPKNTHPLSGGIYAIIFDDTYTYIGSTNNFINRYQQWRSIFINSGQMNRRMEEVFLHCESAVFKVVHICKCWEDRHFLENYYITKSEELGLFKNLLNIETPVIKYYDSSHEILRKESAAAMPYLTSLG